MYGPRPIRFLCTLVCGLFKIPGFSGRWYFKCHVPTPYFGSRLRRQNFNCAPRQYSKVPRPVECCYIETRDFRDFYEINEVRRVFKTLFTWSGGPRSSGVGFFCFHALGNTKQKKPTPLDRGPHSM